MSQLIEFTEEQAMLLDTAMDFCQSQSPMTKVRAQIETDQGFAASVWQSMVDLGWLGITVPEQQGGSGLGLAHVVPVIESMGRAMMATPFLATTLATQALIKGGSDAQKAEWLPKIMAGSIATMALTEADGSWKLAEISASASAKNNRLTLSGTKMFVLDAMQAELIIASVKVHGVVRLVCIPQHQFKPDQIVREVVIDETRRCYQINLDAIDLPASALLPEDKLEPLQCLQHIENAALLLLSAEMAGGLAAALNTIIEYLNTRKQFGRFIGSYQSLKHPAVDILMSLEASRSHVYHAATQMDRANDVNDKRLAIALRMAKAVTSASFAYAGDRAVQFHGGMGFTYECDAQLYLRRALWAQYQFGDEKHQRQLLAPLLLD